MQKSNIRRLRNLVLLRLANRELFYDLRSWSWWRGQLASKFLPFLFCAVTFWSIGFVNGLTYLSKEIDIRFLCVERTNAN